MVAWRPLKPVPEELAREAGVRQTGTSVEPEAQADGLSGFRLPMQIVVATPDYSQTVCSDCGGPTKCKRSCYIHPQAIDLERPTVLQVYREVRECRDAPALDFVDKRGGFTQRAKQKAVASVTEDGMLLERESAYRARKTRTRLNDVRLRTRQRDRRSAKRNDRLRRRKKRQGALVGRIEAVVEREVRRLTA